jgi:ribonuclease HI
MYGPGGHIVSTFSWNLGFTSNNQVEAYSLLQGLLIAKARNIKTLSVVGDSKNTTRHLWLYMLLVDVSLHSIFSHIKVSSKISIKFFHGTSNDICTCC